ncbi:MAG: nucleotidyltransferase domain-containing protein [Ignavibacteriales bacterium]|nr:nucleotidyltransferase domain-containing protein [Ignavibacteriales bacterium]
MDKRKADDIVNCVTRKLIDGGMNVYKVVLFGSYYKGTPHKDSDIDIAVVSDDFKGKDIWERGPMTYDAEVAVIREFDIPVDLIKLTVDEYENETRMIASYVKEGKVVYSSK